MSEKKLHHLIKHISVAMFTTTDAEGMLRSRPLTTVGEESDEMASDLWFFSTEDSGKVDEIDQESHVNVAYADPSKNTYVSVSGIAEVVKDRARIHSMWKPLHKAFFPEGPDDPQIALIRVRVTQAEYWDGPSSKVVNLIGMAKAIVTGEAYRPGSTEKIDMRRRPN